MEEKEEKNLQIRERESRRSGVWNDLRCEAGKSQKYRAERPYEIFLAELISCSRVFDREAEAESRRRWDRIGKPIDGLGKLETMVSKIAGMTGTPDVKIRRKAVAVMCGDHGVVAEGVTQTGQEVTALVAEHIAGEPRGRLSLAAPQARTYLQRIWESPVSFPRNGTAWRGNQCYQRDLRILSPM